MPQDDGRIRDAPPLVVQHLLTLIFFMLFPPQTFEVFVGVSRLNNCEVDEDLAGKCRPNDLQP